MGCGPSTEQQPVDDAPAKSDPYSMEAVRAKVGSDAGPTYQKSKTFKRGNKHAVQRRANNTPEEQQEKAQINDLIKEKKEERDKKKAAEAAAKANTPKVPLMRQITRKMSSVSLRRRSSSGKASKPGSFRRSLSRSFSNLIFNGVVNRSSRDSLNEGDVEVEEQPAMCKKPSSKVKFGDSTVTAPFTGKKDPEVEA